MRQALSRYASEGRIDVGDLPYRLRRAIVAAAHGVRPAAVDAWPVDEFSDAQAVLGITTG